MLIIIVLCVFVLLISNSKQETKEISALDLKFNASESFTTSIFKNNSNTVVTQNVIGMNGTNTAIKINASSKDSAGVSY